ncbi:MAG: DUF2156 domain-containing protein [Ruminococcus sp.]|nr:DUF2156 domain-containing protein [Ruminococcus sp.]
MLEFRALDINDRDRANKALRSSDFMGCEYTFANNLAWCRLADTKVCFYKDFYILCAFGGEGPSFVLPAGQGDLREALAEMKRFSESLGAPLVLTGVTKPSLDMLEEMYPGQFITEPDRDGSDYIYLSSDLISLAGRKFHGKRNHLARFKELDYSYSPIIERDMDDAILFCTSAYNEIAEADHSSVAEQYAINTYFSYFDRLELKGGIIRIGGEVAAVTIGEGLNSDTFCVHIEKADKAYNGAYAGINNLFAESCMAGYKYVNREEDLGLEGLRKAKLSYNPVFLLEKNIVTFK